MKLGEVHPDMGRYLQEDCYCPGEIYGLDRFFFTVFKVDDECRLVERGEDMTAVVAMTCLGGEELAKPQAILFWHDEGDGRIVDAQKVDATENNVGILRTIVQGGKPDGRKIDEFEPGKLKRDVSRVLDMCDMVIVD